MTSGLAQTGERRWTENEVPAGAAPFRPLALRVFDERGRVAERVACTEPFSLEFEYELRAGDHRPARRVVSSRPAAASRC